AIAPVNTCGRTKVEVASVATAPLARNWPFRCIVVWLRYTRPTLTSGLPSPLRNGVYIILALNPNEVSLPLISRGVGNGGKGKGELSLASACPWPQKLKKV